MNLVSKLKNRKLIRITGVSIEFEEKIDQNKVNVNDFIRHCNTLNVKDFWYLEGGAKRKSHSSY